MESSSVKAEPPPPSYTNCVDVNSTVAPGLNQFVEIVGDREKLHFHAPNRTDFFYTPVVQIRDSSENPILSIMSGRLIVSGGNNRVVSTREIVTPNGDALISISGGTKPTLSAGDQVLGMLEDGNLYNRQTMKAKNVMGDVLFHGAGDNSDGNTYCNCCLAGCCCSSNSTEFTFSHNGVTIGQIKRSTNNSSGNELTLFDSARMDPRTKALLIYSGYSAFLMLFADTKCGRIGDRGVGRRLCFIIIVGTLLLICLPILLVRLLI